MTLKQQYLEYLKVFTVISMDEIGGGKNIKY